MPVLGLNAYHGDVSAAILSDGRVMAAVEEERYCRLKHVAGIPREAIRASIELSELRASDISHVAVSRSLQANVLRKLWFAAARRPSLMALGSRTSNALRVRALPDTLVREGLIGPDTKAHWIEHHPAHLASAFFVSPYDTAAVCAIDGFGDFVGTSWGIGLGTRLDVQRRIFFPHSLGLLYLALTQYLGFPRYGDEYKVMGLAAYGQPDFAAQVRRLLRLEKDGGFTLDLAYFCHHTIGVAMTWDAGEPTIGRVFNPRLEELLGPARQPDDPIEPRHEAIAASIQQVFEEAAFHVFNTVYRDTRLKRLCIAGGCAMNSVMNGKIRARTPFDEVYIQPAAGDNGTSLGAALYVQHHVLGTPRTFVMDHAYWGPEFSENEIGTAIGERRIEIEHVRCGRLRFDDTETLCAWTSNRLAEGQIVGWFQGRMEWGARALGNRSILADPRRSDMRDTINTKIKFREKFRPFAPSILEEALDEYFIGAVRDPFMIQVYPVRPNKQSVISAVTHVDGTGRLQTVSRTTNPLYWSLINAFRARTGVPVLLNTSFNENEPIVLRPAEALDCFLRTDMDVLVMGRQALVKAEVAALAGVAIARRPERRSR
jgi:carbamoyltransferase